jgi:glycine cleavage system H lipoate-binding protein
MQLIEGYHITQTEKKAIAQMIEKGYVQAHNKPNTKNYTVLQGTPKGKAWIYKIKIGTKARFSIGANIEWQYQTVTVKI